MNLRIRWLLCALLLGTTGCAKHYVAIIYSTDLKVLSPEAEVSQTQTYQSQRSAIRTLTIRYPNSCLDASAATQGGVARADESKLIMRTECAVWLADLERALIAAHYRVISWDTLKKLEDQYHLSTYVAARQLGADAVLVINSFENNPVGSAKVTGIKYRYFQSDPKGDLLGPERLDQRQREILSTLTRRRTLESGDLSPTDATGAWGVGATLDASVVMTATGEAVWIYRRSVIRPYSNSPVKQKVLFRGRELYWRPVEPDGANFQDVELRRYASADENNDYERAQLADRQAAERRAVARSVLEDFMNKFTH